MSDPIATLESYLQADAPLRRANRSAFIDALAAVARDTGADAARELARRAVSPLLDYGSLRRLRKFLGPSDETRALRVAVLGGPTTAQLVELLGLFLAGAGIDARFYEGAYGNFRQEILASGGDLERFDPQIIIIATSSHDAARPPDLSADRAAVQFALEAEADDWIQLWTRANQLTGATIVQNTFEAPPWSALGHYAVRHGASREHYCQSLNALLASRAPGFVVLHDLDALVRQVGSERWFDPRWYLEAKMPCGADALVIYAHSLASLVAAAVGKSRKVLVLDLDNTLWGGVIGDAGVGGIRLGQGSSEGEAFVAFQRYAQALHARGIVLAVCSKNDDARAREPFEAHSEMVLRLSDIACFVASWRDKPDMLREIADRLDVGLDALVFVDDHPAERALVRQLLPAVAVPDLPEDPAGYIEAVARHRYFETVAFTREDAERTTYYRANEARKASASSADDLDSFLASLEMTARVEAIGSLNIERVTQLINKTNQFNLTTRRYSFSEVQQMAGDPAWLTLTVQLKDRFGDNGLIAVVLGRAADRQLTIDTWLMSCRVLQRGVERFTLDALAQAAHARHCEALLGLYAPSAKNSMVRDHYARLGFHACGDDVPGTDAGSTRWRLSLDAYAAVPSHIRREP